jgi:hypothetical protein
MEFGRKLYSGSPAPMRTKLTEFDFGRLVGISRDMTESQDDDGRGGPRRAQAGGC